MVLGLHRSEGTHLSWSNGTYDFGDGSWPRRSDKQPQQHSVPTALLGPQNKEISWHLWGFDTKVMGVAANVSAPRFLGPLTLSPAALCCQHKVSEGIIRSHARQDSQKGASHGPCGDSTPKKPKCLQQAKLSKKFHHGCCKSWIVMDNDESVDILNPTVFSWDDDSTWERNSQH